ncbi:MAG: TlpA disulfide reductase family protein [Planctomycetota bacterium]
MGRFGMKGLVLALGILAGAGAPPAADAPKPKTAPALPADGWVNGGPYTLDGLKGKVVVLYFYEEECPRCAAMWPTIQMESGEFRDQPVLFIAVNSGTPKSEVEGYVKTNKIDWPVIADTGRVFEKTCGVPGGEIGLRNIHQVGVITPDGGLRWYGWFQAAVKSNLAKAAWKMDPARIPAPLKEAWKHYEFGRYGEAAPTVARAMKGSGEAREAATRMFEEMNAEIRRRLDEGKKEEAVGNVWKAYRFYDSVLKDFKVFPDSAEAQKALGKVAGAPAVRKEIAAREVLERARKMMAVPNTGKQKEARQILEGIVRDAGETEAAAEAKRILKAM